MANKTEPCADCGGRGFFSKPSDKCPTCKGRGYTFVGKAKPSKAGGSSFMVNMIKLVIFLVIAYVVWDKFLKNMMP